MLRKYTFIEFGGGTTDPNAFKCIGGKREEKDKQSEKSKIGGVVENGRKKQREIKRENKSAGREK